MEGGFPSIGENQIAQEYIKKIVSKGKGYRSGDQSRYLLLKLDVTESSNLQVLRLQFKSSLLLRSLKWL